MASAPVKDSRAEKNDGNGVDDKPSATTSEFNAEILPIHYYQLTPALEKEARTQLNETEETRKSCLVELRDLIKSEKRLITPTDDNFLLAFLRARKFSVKRAFSLLKSFWSFRKQHKKIFDRGFTLEVKSLLLRSYVGLLLSRDKNGCAVFVFKIALWDPDIDSYESLFLAISGTLVHCLEHPATHIAGFRAIIDLRGIGWKQMRYFTPGNALLAIRSTQFSFPARFKGIHVLCDSRMVKCCWNLLYPFLTSKLKSRTYFHGEDFSPIREYIHPSALPSEFGGQGPRFDNSSWPAIWKVMDPKIEEMAKCGYRD